MSKAGASAHRPGGRAAQTGRDALPERSSIARRAAPPQAGADAPGSAQGPALNPDWEPDVSPGGGDAPEAGADGRLGAIWHPSPNHGARRGGQKPDLIVLHYTAMGSAKAALERLCDPVWEVSSHWLIGRDGRLWSLVPESRRAWHAGAGSWGGIGDVNSRSVGIEIDNDGQSPFTAPAMAVLEQLLAQVMRRWSIPPEGVIGHSDMAPHRKADPGRRFDWERLARLGLSVWPGAAQIVPPDAEGGERQPGAHTGSQADALPKGLGGQVESGPDLGALQGSGQGLGQNTGQSMGQSMGVAAGTDPGTARETGPSDPPASPSNTLPACPLSSAVASPAGPVSAGSLASLQADPEAFLADAARFGWPAQAGVEAVLAALRLRFRPGAAGPLAPEDCAIAAGLARRWPFCGAPLARAAAKPARRA